MTDTSTTDSKSSQRPQQRRGSASGSGKNRRNFNPMHPSMELPPEQLIRLLGVESKKTRKYQKSRRTPSGAKPAPAPQTSKARPASAPANADKTSPRKQETPAPKAPAKPKRNVEYERTATPVFKEKRTRLLIPSLVIGLVTGIAVSAYMFWSQPSTGTAPQSAAPAATDSKRPQSSPGQLVTRNPRTPAGGSASAEKVPAGLPRQAPARARNAHAGTAANWEASVKAERKQLQRAAERRLDERLMHTELERESARIPIPAPAPAYAPLPATEPPGQAAAPALPDTAPPVTGSTAQMPGASPAVDQVLSPSPGADAVTPPADIEARTADAVEVDTDATNITPPALFEEDADNADVAPQEALAPVDSEVSADEIFSPGDDSGPDTGTATDTSMILDSTPEPGADAP